MKVFFFFAQREEKPRGAILGNVKCVLASFISWDDRKGNSRARFVPFTAGMKGVALKMSFNVQNTVTTLPAARVCFLCKEIKV